jgi:perosamine synthetase
VLTTGGGGMVVTDDEKKAEHIKYIVSQARDNSDTFHHGEMGFNYRMTNIEAAIGLAQLSRIEGFLEKKKAFKEIYNKILCCLPHAKFQQQYRGASSSNWLSCIEVHNGKEVEVLKGELKRRNIETRRVFCPVNEMNYLKGFSKACPNSADIYRKGLCLPSSTLNGVDNIKEAALEIREVLTAVENC